MTCASWRIVRLGDYCSKIGSGSTPRGGESVYQDSGVSFIRSQNVYNGQFTREGLAYLNEEQADQLKGVTVETGDVLLNITGDSVARCCRVPDDVLPARVNQHVAIIRSKPENFDSRFVSQFMISPLMQDTMLSLAGSGGTRKALTKDMIERFELPLPPRSVQERIADILSTYDDLIENNRRRMALLEEAARQLYREWFVRFRFPGYEHAKLCASPLGMIPTDWRVVRLQEITTKIGSGATPRGGMAAYSDQGITLIRSLNVYDDRFEDGGLAFINEEQAAALSHVAVEPRDILLNITGASVARCCMAPERHLPARVNQHVMIIRADPALADPYFVLSAINSDERKRQLLSYAQGGGATREALTKETVSNFQIVLPDDKLLRMFGGFAGDTIRQQEVLASQSAGLRKARDLLLPRLMSGEIAV